MSQSSDSAVSTKFWRPGGAPVPTLFERYKILGIIGQGGMGTVYKGFHLNLKRFVAIKTLRVDQDQSPDLVLRFRREMELVGQVDHPHVVRASDAGEKNGVFYLVMELLAGTDLGKLVSRRGQLEVADACEIARQAALGLDYLHQSFVHRDIKPSNLMLTPTGIVKILDLGLARGGPGQEHTPHGYAMGTFSYMAPEQARADAKIDGRADIYGLGCTLFKLLTGRAPFGGTEYDSPAKQILAHSQVPISSIPEFQALPMPVREVLLRMTAKDPAERYPTGSEVAAALAPLAAGSQLVALLGPDAGAEGPEVRPLSGPLPSDLSRLSEMPVEMAATSSVAPTSALTQPGLGKVPVAAMVGAGILIVVTVVGFAWILVARWPVKPVDPPEPPGKGLVKPKEIVKDPPATPVALDDLPLHKYHSLMNFEAMPIGHEVNDGNWRWDTGAQRLEANGPRALVFPLGTVTRVRFGIEADLMQTPWTGNIGIFWGYHEDEERKKARKPNDDFAWFQMVCLQRDSGKLGEAMFSVGRGTGSLRYNSQGEIGVAKSLLAHHDVRTPGRESRLHIEVLAPRLLTADFAGMELGELCSEETNRMYGDKTFQGKIGVFTFSHSTVFRNVRFISLSKN